MVLSTSAPIERAVVAKLRSNGTLKSSLTGGIHEAFAPEKTEYPLLTYQTVYAPYGYIWGSVFISVGIDINVWAKSSVDAKNIDALVFQTLHDASLSVDGQTTLICRRVADLRNYDVDDEGRKVYAVGGTYEITTDQPM